MHEKKDGTYIGLLSGTSIDGVDAALFEFKGEGIEMLASINNPYPPKMKADILNLCSPGNNEIDQMGEVDALVGRHFAFCVEQLLKASRKAPEDIQAIGSHGQTIRHRPNLKQPFTLQIGDPNQIAYHTQINTIADFRRRDIAAGGHGAPLAPAFHQSAFFSEDESRCIINIGGMANITAIAPSSENTIGYDIGPGNVLLDSWIQFKQDKAYDKSGQWSASGQSNEELLNELYAHPFFSKAHPKSTGREDFNLEWLHGILSKGYDDLKDEDVQSTLCDLTVKSISAEVLKHDCDAVYICGGGAHNRELMQRLRESLSNHKVDSTGSLGIHPDWVEAALFAWLAKQTMENLPGNLPSVTGAKDLCILGAIYPV